MRTLTIHLGDGILFTSDKYTFQTPDKTGNIEIVNNDTQEHVAFFNVPCSVETTPNPTPTSEESIN